MPLWVSNTTRIGALFAALDETFALDRSALVDADTGEPIADCCAALRHAYERFPHDVPNWPVYADRDLAGDARRGLPDMLAPDFRALRVERRRDRVASRTRRQFELRDEVVAVPVPPPPFAETAS